MQRHIAIEYIFSRAQTFQSCPFRKSKVNCVFWARFPSALSELFM